MKPFILYHNIFDATTTATDTDAGGDYDPAYVSDSRPYTWWQAASVGTKYLYIDAGAATAVNALSIFGHNLTGATVSVESSTSGAWGGEEVEQLAGFNPTDDKIIVKTMTGATIRYWRIKIISAAIVPKIAVAMLGERLDFPLYPDSPFTLKQEKINTATNVSRLGHLLGADIKYTPVKVSAQFTWVPMTFINGDYETFWNTHGRKMKPFIWVPNITEWPASAFFVRFVKGFSHGAQLKDTTNAEQLKVKFEGISE